MSDKVHVKIVTPNWTYEKTMDLSTYTFGQAMQIIIDAARALRNAPPEGE